MSSLTALAADPPRRSTAPSSRLRGGWLLWLNVSVLLLCAVYVALCTLLLITVGAQALHDALGEGVYNGWLAGGGLFNSLIVLVPLLLFDLLVGAGWLMATMLRHRTARWPAALLLVVALVGAVRLAHGAAVSPDPLGDQLFSLLMPMDTVYAAGYSPAAFQQLRTGMSEAEVLARVGPPLRIQQWRGADWRMSHYSWSPSGGNYWKRLVSYGPDDRVIRITAELWVD